MTDLIQKGKVNMVVDGQFGSTGKGVLSGHLATSTFGGGDGHSTLFPMDILVTNAAPNAGHTVDYCDGKGRQVAFHLPVSALIRPEAMIYLCAGSIIDPEKLVEECERLGVDTQRVFIHPLAAVVLPHHKEEEAQQSSSATKIGSTQKGVGAALCSKIARKGNVASAHPLLRDKFHIREIPIEFMMDQGATVFMEVPQGFSLSLNHGMYPYTTSRNVTVAAALNDLGVHPSYLGSVHMSLRTYPIRVGNIVVDGQEIGHSGPFYPDSEELAWEDLNVEPERTTVTQRIRRIATFSLIQYKAALRVNKPDFVFLNFANYYKDEADAREQLDRIQQIRGVDFLGVGPTNQDVVPVSGLDAATIANLLCE